MNDNPDWTSDFEDESSGVSEFTDLSTTGSFFAYEHGRRYQGRLADRYGLPNDNAEQFREGLKHKLYTDYLIPDQLFLSPVGDHAHKIVDLGTGSGLWALDVADKYPGTRVIGTDLSPIQPVWTPPNVEFRVEDLEDAHREWTNIYSGADLIFNRSLLQTVRDPRRVLARSFEKLKPGGWIECHDVAGFPHSDDNTVTPSHPFTVLCEKVLNVFQTLYGWHLCIADEVPGMLDEIGFTNIQTRVWQAPIGRWHTEPRQREIGLFTKSLCDGFVLAVLTRHEAMDMTMEEAQELADDIGRSFNDFRIHARLTFYAAWAQKPLHYP